MALKTKTVAIVAALALAAAGGVFAFMPGSGTQDATVMAAATASPAKGAVAPVSDAAGKAPPAAAVQPAPAPTPTAPKKLTREQLTPPPPTAEEKLQAAAQRESNF